MVALWQLNPSAGRYFIGLSLLICACIASATILIFLSVPRGTLASAAFWLMFIFAVARLGSRDVSGGLAPCALFLYGVFVLLAAGVVAKLMTYAGLSQSLSLLFYALLTASGLAVYYAGIIRSSDSEAADSRQQAIDDATGPDEPGDTAESAPRMSKSPPLGAGGCETVCVLGASGVRRPGYP